MLLDCVFVGFGLVTLVIAAFGKRFYTGYDDSGPNIPSSTWSGKLLFLVVGLFFIALGSLDHFGVIAMSRK